MAAAREISDDRALKLSQAAQRIGRKIDPRQYHNQYDAPKWTDQMETLLSRLPGHAIDQLVALIEDGPNERPDS
jgi:hypothetical protein